MTGNVGILDRIIRILVGLFILSFFFWGPRSAWALLGLVPLLTGVIGWCGAYTLFGISSCKTKSISEGRSQE